MNKPKYVGFYEGHERGVTTPWGHEEGRPVIKVIPIKDDAALKEIDLSKVTVYELGNKVIPTEFGPARLWEE